MLEGKTAVITGRNQRHRQGDSRGVPQTGAQRSLSRDTRSRKAKAADEIGCDFVACDVRDYDEVVELVEGTVDRYGSLDVMVNNAGVGSEARLGNMELDEWRRVVDTNLDGVMHGSKAALPHLLESEGCIINVASIYGLLGVRGRLLTRRRRAASSTSPSRSPSTMHPKASASTVSAPPSSVRR